MIRAILFDIGGVLAHDVWENMLLDRTDGIVGWYHLDETKVRMVGEELWDIFAHRAPVHQDDWQELEREYWEALISKLSLPATVDEMLMRTDRFIQPIEGMISLLERLQTTGIQMAVLSNNTEFWYERQKRKLDFGRFFKPELVILSNRIGTSKASPSLAMFNNALATLRLDSDQCLLVDDRVENIDVAIEYGLTGILFPRHAKHPSLYLEAILGQMRLL